MLSPVHDEDFDAIPPAPKPTVAASPTHHMAIADGLRAFAILSVVFHHVLMFARPTVGHRMLNFGFLGVWGIGVFFVLSGFLLGKEFLGAILDDRTFPSVRKFFARRFLRIYPLYIVCVIASIVFAAVLMQPASALVIVQYVFVLQGTSTEAIAALNGPLWTMGVDAAFYLVLPILMGILYAVTRGRSRTTKIATILTALATIAGASIVYRYIQCVRHPVALSDFANAVVYVRTPFGMAMAFAIGISIALATLVIPRERFTRRWYAMLVVVGCAIGASVPLAFRPEVGYAPNARAFLRLTLIDPIAAISAGLILYGLINGGLPFITRIARSKFVAAVAALSYAIYLFHYPILEALDVHLLHGTYGAKVFVELGACVLVLILPIAIVTHRFVEQPFLTIKDRLRQRPAS